MDVSVISSEAMKRLINLASKGYGVFLEDVYELVKSRRRVLNVLDYGAKGNGIQDDTAAIQSVFEKVRSGDVVYFPKGTYLVTGLEFHPVLPNERVSRVTIVGDGWGSCLKLKSGSSRGILSLDDVPRVMIRNLRFDGNRDNQTTPLFGLRIERSEFSSILSCEISKCSGDALVIRGKYVDSDFRGNDEVHLFDVWVQENSGNGLIVDSVADLTVSDSQFEFNGQRGMHIFSTAGIASGNITIKGCHVLSNDHRGIEIESDSARLWLMGNHIRNNGLHGIRSVGGKQHVYIGNNIHVNGRITPSSGCLIGYQSNVCFVANEIGCRDFPVTQTAGIEAYSVDKLILLGNNLANNLYGGAFLDSATASTAACFGNVDADDTSPILRDSVTGTRYKLKIQSGSLVLQTV